MTMAPVAFKNHKQFILYDRAQKMPIDYRTLRAFPAGGDWHTDPEACTDYMTARSLVNEQQGLGFLFKSSDPFFFVDIDKCLINGDWSTVAQDLLSRLPGAAVEVSQSGKGLHVFGSYTGPEPEHGCKNNQYGIELYTSGRFAALTGDRLQGDAALDCTANLQSVIQLYYPRTAGDTDAEWTDGPVSEYGGPANDDTLIKMALKSKSTASRFGAGASFAELWAADETALAAAYPDAYQNRPYDNSSADAALAQHLAFWTGKDCGRMLDLMKRSALVREKWDREDYLERTILNAVSVCTSTLTSSVKPLSDDVTGPELVSGFQYLGASQQLEHFKGCTYIQDIHRIFIPSGALLKSEQFNASFGGFVFQVSDDGATTTKKAFDAFTESQVVRYPKAETMCFRPDLEPGKLIKQDGQSQVNVYVPVTVPRKSGDVTPFLKHLSKVLPDITDQKILMSFMAACVQYKGVKFHWAPVLQGVEGNGKTFFTVCVAAAIGEKYVHMPRASEIDEKFNSWLFGKLFIGVEDIYVPYQKREIIEALKPMITGRRLARRAMQQDQVMQDICCNFIFNSNHPDCIQKTQNDRRFAVFYSAQQDASDIVRDGMSGDYFPDLYEWLYADGYAIVTDFLYSYDIPEQYNPATACHRAPVTSSTGAAIVASMGPIEQEILEAVDEGRLGFAGGWVSSIMLDRLLKEKRKDSVLTISKRKEVLKTLGYDWHPGLKNGRVNNIVIPDGGKPRLFIRDGHPCADLKTGKEIAAAYQTAQTDNKAAEVFGR